MIYYVKNSFRHDDSTSYEAGTQLTREQYEAVLGTPNEHLVMALPGDARARIEMRDVTPNKPVGASPDPENATSGYSHNFAHRRPAHYMGGQEAIGTIQNPNREERARDANPNAVTDLPGAPAEVYGKHDDHDPSPAAVDSVSDDTADKDEKLYTGL